MLKHIYQNIEGWFDKDDANLYRQVVQMAPLRGAKFVEVGSFKGRSAACMAVEIENSGKLIDFTCVDSWENEWEPAYTVFKENLSGFHEPDVIRGRSVEVADKFFENDLDFVYLDGDHSYPAVIYDIRAWLPKVKVGGIIGGHDWAHAPVRQAVNELLGEWGVNVIGNSWWVFKQYHVAPPKPKVLDCFCFHNEFDVLEARLEYLYDHVDKFILCESDMTFSGNKKPMHFMDNMKRYSKYLDKILYVIVHQKPEDYHFTKPVAGQTDLHGDSWRTYHDQLDHIVSALKVFDDNDLVLMSDVDEIPTPESIERAKEYLLNGDPVVAFNQELYFYGLKWRQDSRWVGTTLCTVKNAIDIKPSGLKKFRWDNFAIVKGGYHLSYWMKPEDIRLKLESFSHQEYNSPEYTDLKVIEQRMKNGEDPLGRPNMLVATNPDRFPSDFYNIFLKYS